VAERYLTLIRDEYPREWWCDPKLTPFTPGGFATLEVNRQVVRRLVEHCGVQSLGIIDKPDLRAALLKFANTPPEPS
jgi:hypothetical protein